MLSEYNRKLALDSVLLRSLPKTEAQAMLDDASLHKLRNGETLFLQGDIADHLFIVLDGWLKLYRVDENGQEAVVSVFSKSQSFGEAVALSAGAYPVSAEAVTQATVAQFSARQFTQRITSQPELALALVASTFRHLHELVGQVEQLKARTGAQRVAEFLLELCTTEDGACAVQLPYDKVLIAGRLGMKPESLSRVFQKLKGIGVSIQRNQAIIKDVRQLRDFCNADRN
ncbi:Crp/Fnr family transcriptional regulator [Marivita sp. S6314]|uniref:Crp/Fnr family transcriptional regulator n=1 Tax=Marivita sp. S6314 TaxID=2926406 RepID=UPI001FF13284|nr:Crp/Fnr family transcriptional regulator [Marivita sp. S6314]MCK0151002.1 Crp/Fnr family transcriptional regulator [Marivita sp. S6314]